MQLTNFSSLSPEEFFSLNRDVIPKELEDKFFDYSLQIKELEDELERLERNNELAWEQVGFARDLVEQLDHFAENNLSKVKLKVYNSIRENTYFEV